MSLATRRFNKRHQRGKELPFSLTGVVSAACPVAVTRGEYQRRSWLPAFLDSEYPLLPFSGD